MEYKKTLNMSKSGFPMRAGLPMREPDIGEMTSAVPLLLPCRGMAAHSPRVHGAGVDNGPLPSGLTVQFSRMLRGDLRALRPLRLTPAGGSLGGSLYETLLSPSSQFHNIVCTIPTLPPFVKGKIRPAGGL